MFSFRNSLTFCPEHTQQAHMGMVSGGWNGSFLLPFHLLATPPGYGFLGMVARRLIHRHGLYHGGLHGTLCPAHRAVVCPGCPVCILPVGRGAMATPVQAMVRGFRRDACRSTCRLLPVPARHPLGSPAGPGSLTSPSFSSCFLTVCGSISLPFCRSICALGR